MTRSGAINGSASEANRFFATAPAVVTSCSLSDSTAYMLHSVKIVPDSLIVYAFV